MSDLSDFTSGSKKNVQFDGTEGVEECIVMQIQTESMESIMDGGSRFI